jgi:hypothetical protein
MFLCNKLRLYMLCVRPIIALALPCLRFHCEVNCGIVQVQQYKVLKQLPSAPYFVRNDSFKDDLHIPQRVLTSE